MQNLSESPVRKGNKDILYKCLTMTKRNRLLSEFHLVQNQLRALKTKNYIKTITGIILKEEYTREESEMKAS